MVHVEIKPIKVFVQESVLFNEDNSKTDLIPATIFCISSYEKEALTFGIVLDNGSVFFYIPIHKISLSKDCSFEYSLKDLIYNNNESINFNISYFKYLEKQPLKIYLKYLNKWDTCKYIATLDWFEGNDLVHLVLISNGQLACMPSHKLNFTGEEKLESYKKIKSSWIV